VDIGEFINNLKTVFEDADKIDLSPATELSHLEEWDSLAVLGFITMIDAEYGVKIAASEIQAAKTVQDLFRLVDVKAKPQ
jgi:acyl carrier protein